MPLVRQGELGVEQHHEDEDGGMGGVVKIGMLCARGHISCTVVGSVMYFMPNTLCYNCCRGMPGICCCCCTPQSENFHEAVKAAFHTWSAYSIRARLCVLLVIFVASSK